MECILKYKDKIFTGDSINEVEMDFFDWLEKQDAFVVDSYFIFGISRNPDGTSKTEILKDTAALRYSYGYIYVVCVDLDEAMEEWEDATYEASYHFNKNDAIRAAKMVFDLNEKAVSTRVVAHKVGAVDNHNVWDNDFDIMCAHFNRT